MFIILAEALIKAFHFLPHLVEFAWIGRSPSLHQSVVNALGKMCRALLRLQIV
jgi:hypothetical protein